VVFFDSVEDAEKAGFRPNLRATSDATKSAKRTQQMITSICTAIKSSEKAPSLAQLGRQFGLSEAHIQRIFKSHTGVTPKQYALEHQIEKIRKNLISNKTTVTNSIYDSGYASSSGFYQKSTEFLGMSPSSYKDGGKNMQIMFAVGECSLGSILVARSSKGICAILFGDDPDRLVVDIQKQFPKAKFVGGNATFERTVAEVVGLVEQPNKASHLPLDLRGTAFQRLVWNALRQLRPGETISYSELAARIGMPKAARAVANACGSNSLAVAIPCHRVIRKDGDASGYRWGAERKTELLRREGMTIPGD
jgi:AraC family transcriptional regulator of adaptative response/methylated-DNA-[protein]-cysteine methyltransferase